MSNPNSFVGPPTLIVELGTNRLLGGQGLEQGEAVLHAGRRAAVAAGGGGVAAAAWALHAPRQLVLSLKGSSVV